MKIPREYVLGFFFSEDKKNVALIRKTKPIWQAGLLNGIGGKVEDGEVPYQTMVREFKEETDFEFTNWKFFAIMKNSQFNVYCYVGYGDPFKLKTTTEEVVTVVPVDKLHINRVIPNIKWLVHMGLDSGFEPVTIKYLEADKYIEK